MTENLKLFLCEAEKDKEFMEKLKTAKSPEEVAEMAKEKGFELTADEVMLQPDGEISDAELDEVSGGRHWWISLEHLEEMLRKAANEEMQRRLAQDRGESKNFI